MNSKAIKERIENVESSLRQSAAAHIESHFFAARQTGNTDLCIHMAKTQKARILAWDAQQAASIRDRCGLNSGVIVESVQATPRISETRPLVIDHYAVTQALTEQRELLHALTAATRDYIGSLESENAAMRERVTALSADLESYRGQYANLKSEMDAIAKSVKEKK